MMSRGSGSVIEPSGRRNLTSRVTKLVSLLKNLMRLGELTVAVGADVVDHDEQRHPSLIRGRLVHLLMPTIFAAGLPAPVITVVIFSAAARSGSSARCA